MVPLRMFRASTRARLVQALAVSQTLEVPKAGFKYIVRESDCRKGWVPTRSAGAGTKFRNRKRPPADRVFAPLADRCGDPVAGQPNDSVTPPQARDAAADESVAIEWAGNLLVLLKDNPGGRASAARLFRDWSPSTSGAWAIHYVAKQKCVGDVARSCRLWLARTSFVQRWSADREVATAICKWCDQGGDTPVPNRVHAAGPEEDEKVDRAVLLVLAHTCYEVCVPDGVQWQGTVDVSVPWTKVTSPFVSSAETGYVTLYNYKQGYLRVSDTVKDRTPEEVWSKAVEWHRPVPELRCSVVSLGEVYLPWDRRAYLDALALGIYLGRARSAVSSKTVDFKLIVDGKRVHSPDKPRKGKKGKALLYSTSKFWCVEWEQAPGHPRWEMEETCQAVSKCQDDPLLREVVAANVKASWLGYDRSAYPPVTRLPDEVNCRKRRLCPAEAEVEESSLEEVKLFLRKLDRKDEVVRCASLSKPPIVVATQSSRNQTGPNLVRLIACVSTTVLDEVVGISEATRRMAEWSSKGGVVRVGPPTGSWRPQEEWEAVCRWVKNCTRPFPAGPETNDPTAAFSESAPPGTLCVSQVRNTSHGDDSLWERRPRGYVLVAVIDRAGSGTMWCRTVRGCMSFTDEAPTGDPESRFHGQKLDSAAYVWGKAGPSGECCAKPRTCAHYECCYLCGGVRETRRVSRSDGRTRIYCKTCADDAGAYPVCLVCRVSHDPPQPSIRCKKCRRACHSGCITPEQSEQHGVWRERPGLCPSTVCADPGLFRPESVTEACGGCHRNIVKGEVPRWECCCCHRWVCNNCTLGEAGLVPLCKWCVTCCAHGAPSRCPICSYWWQPPPPASEKEQAQAPAGSQ